MHNGFYSGSNSVANAVQNNIEAKISRKYYNTIDYSMSYNEAEALLLDHGFEKIPYEELNEEVSGEFGFGEWEESTYYNSDGVEIVRFRLNGIGSVIYVSNTGDEPIIFKTLEESNSAVRLIGHGLTKNIKPSKFLKSLDKLELGMNYNTVQKKIDINNADLVYIFSEKKNGAVYEQYDYYWELFLIEDEDYDKYNMPLSVVIFFENGQLLGVMQDDGKDYTAYLGDIEQMNEIYADSNKGMLY